MSWSLQKKASSHAIPAQGGLLRQFLYPRARYGRRSAKASLPTSTTSGISWHLSRPFCHSSCGANISAEKASI